MIPPISSLKIAFALRRVVQYSLLATSAKRERKGLSAGIKEPDLKESVSCPTFLPNELIHSRLQQSAAPYRAGRQPSAIAAPLRSRARRDSTEAAVDLYAVIGSFLSAVVLGIKVRNG
jgi:hypothetical protein